MTEENRGVSLEDFVAETTEEVRRAADLTMLRELVDQEPYNPDPEAQGWGDRRSEGVDLSDDEYEAFSDMLEHLEKRPGLLLTEKQREWAYRRARDLGLDCVNPAPDNSRVPRGHEVELAVASMPKPLKPPGRR